MTQMYILLSGRCCVHEWSPLGAVITLKYSFSEPERTGNVDILIIVSDNHRAVYDESGRRTQSIQTNDA